MKTKTFLLLLVGLIFCTTATYAQIETDVEGSKDHPLISRFQGSVIVLYVQKEFDEYTLPLGKRPEDDGIFKKLNLEGKVTRIQYAGIPESRSFLEVYRNYEIALKNAGFEILFSGKGEGLGYKWPDYIFDDNNSPLPEGNRLPSNNEPTQRYLSAKLVRSDGDIYVSLFITKDSWHQECPLVQLDIIKIKPMETGMITVNADLLANNIAKTGHIAVYGLHFDTGKAELKPESGPVLEEIAKLLKNNSGLKLYIVGHTDNVGEFNNNILLSEQRAKAVLKELVSKYTVNETQLEAYGNGPLAPVASNKDEAGRAKNRRVELVEQ
jgi:hypothetical protein